MSRRKLYVAVAATAVLAGAAAAWWQLRPAPTTVASAPGLWQASFKDVQGRPQALAQWQGKPLVVNFWATWCGPCREEMPEFQAASQALGDRGQFVGIAIDQAAAADKFARDNGVSYAILVGEQDALDLMRAEGNRIGALPYTIIYDASGRRVAAHAGRLTRDKLDAYLAPLLAK